MAAAFTAVEVMGLALVIRAGATVTPSADWTSGPPSAIPWAGIGLATVFAFFAFVGFEDIVNLAEEVKRPSRTLPIAILVSLVATSLLYGAVSIAAVRAVDVELLALSDRPLALVFEAGGGSARTLDAIAVAAALNGTLAQIVMASRVLFGLGRQERLLSVFHQTDRRLGTPVAATLTVGGVVLVGALTFDVAALAELTSIVLLAVFCVMNVSLLVIKRRAPEAVFSVPPWVPSLGLAGSVAALIVAVLTT